MQVFNQKTFLDAIHFQEILPSELYSEIECVCNEINSLEDDSIPNEFEYHIVIIDLDQYDSYDALVRDVNLPPMVLNSWVRDAGYENYDSYGDGISCTTVVTDDYGSGYSLILLNDNFQDECIFNNFIEAAQNLDY